MQSPDYPSMSYEALKASEVDAVATPTDEREHQPSDDEMKPQMTNSTCEYSEITSEYSPCDTVKPCEDVEMIHSPNNVSDDSGDISSEYDPEQGFLSRSFDRAPSIAHEYGEVGGCWAPMPGWSDWGITRLSHLRILILDQVHPIIVHTNEIAREAPGRIGQLVEVRRIEVVIQGSTLELPVLMPVEIFGIQGEAIHGWIQEKVEAITVLVEQQLEVVAYAPGVSWVPFNWDDFDRSKELCSLQLEAAQAYVDAKRVRATEKAEWIRMTLSDTIERQVEGLRSFPTATIESLRDLIFAQKHPKQQYSLEDIAKVFHAKANAVISVISDEVKLSSSAMSDNAQERMDNIAQQFRERVEKWVDMEILNFTYDYINSLVSQAQEQFDKSVPNEVIATVLLQASVVLTFVKARVSEVLNTTETISGYDLSFVRHLLTSEDEFTEMEDDEGLMMPSEEQRSRRSSADFHNINAAISRRSSRR